MQVLLQAVNIDISPLIVVITSGEEQYLKLSFSPLLGLEPQDAHGCLAWIVIFNLPFLFPHHHVIVYLNLVTSNLLGEISCNVSL